MPEVNEIEETPAGLLMSPMDFFQEIMSGTWVNREDAAKFAEDFLDFYAAASTLSSTYNQTVWTGWETGKVSRDIKGTREQRDPNGDKPGRKAQPKTAAQQLLKNRK